jgi:hypothetical protein
MFSICDESVQWISDLIKFRLHERYSSLVHTESGAVRFTLLATVESVPVLN